MAMKCASCGSTSTQAGLGTFQCIDCGALTGFDGEAAEGGLDQAGRDAALARLAPRETNIVGNLADLQRIGGAVAHGASNPVKEGVEAGIPEGTQDKLKAEAKATAAFEGVAGLVRGDEVTTAKGKK